MNMTNRALAYVCAAIGSAGGTFANQCDGSLTCNTCPIDPDPPRCRGTNCF
jgi:hypothetical protein